MPRLRILRDWEWRQVPGQELLIGGPPLAVELVALDTLQYEDAEGAWQPVPVVEMSKPAHPHEQQRERRGLAYSFLQPKSFRKEKW